MDDLYSLGMCKTKEKLMYPIIVEKTQDGYSLNSPDFEEITINVHDLEVRMVKIKDLLKGKSNDLYIPEPSKMEDLKVPNSG